MIVGASAVEVEIGDEHIRSAGADAQASLHRWTVCALQRANIGVPREGLTWRKPPLGFAKDRLGLLLSQLAVCQRLILSMDETWSVI